MRLNAHHNSPFPTPHTPLNPSLHFSPFNIVMAEDTGHVDLEPGVGGSESLRMSGYCVDSYPNG
jgi:hypothetical protein